MKNILHDFEIRHKLLDERSLEHICRGRSDATDSEARQAANDAVTRDSPAENCLMARAAMN